MNLNEQTYRIKQMMGISEQREDIHISNPIAIWREDVLKNVDVGIKNIFLCVEKKSGQTLPLKYGKRNYEQNAKAGGSGNSAHLRGLALDIHFDTPQKDLIKKLIGFASECGALGIGVYKDGQDLHIDIDSSKGGRRAWGPSYSSSDIPNWAKYEVQKHLSGGYSQKNIEQQSSFDCLKNGKWSESEKVWWVKLNDGEYAFSKDGSYHKKGSKNKGYYKCKNGKIVYSRIKNSADIIFMGGKESVIPFDTQLKSLTNSTGNKVVLPFHSNQLEDIKKAIQQNPQAKIVLYSLSCDNANTIASLIKDKIKLYIVEPFAKYGNQAVVDAVKKNGVPSKNVVTGPLNVRGDGVVQDSTKTPQGFEHSNVLSFVAKNLLN